MNTTNKLLSILAALVAMFAFNSVRLESLDSVPSRCLPLMESTASKKPRKQAKQQRTAKIFNPWTDFEFKAKSTTSSDDFSSIVQCVGTGTGDINLQGNLLLGTPPGFSGRSCWYRNLYYNINDQRFHYFPSPSEQNLWDVASQSNDSIFEHQQKFYTSVGTSYEGRPDQWYDKRGQRTPWQPFMHKKSSLPDFSTLSPASSVFLLFQPSHSENFGHFLWDDLLSLFSLMDLFELQDIANPAVPFFVEQRGKAKGFGGKDPLFRCSPRNAERWENCTKMYKRCFPSLMGIATDCSGDIIRTGNFLQNEVQLRMEGNSTLCFKNMPRPTTEFIQIPDALVGIGRLGYSGCWSDCSLGRGQQYRRFRSYLLSNLDIDADAPPKGFITFSLPTNSSRPDKVYRFESEIKACLETYGEEQVKIVSMPDYSLVEQAQMVANSAILFANHGGGSAISIFLSQGATFVNYWHWAVAAKGRVFRKMDHQFYESVSHFETVYVSETERLMLDRTMSLVDIQLNKFKQRWMR